ncbi:hypothetical protein UAY_01816 [Enterococcus moraviensis ATCC BAA-383]|uniref:Uncharacterized protein n=1 Tax=Enterococcus moraviensis ATCC BAA-383 TaxID=1158609 RepID=R2SZU3_9ENTE|nr:hypothetical protein [Enterococcus moraviensis]EOI00713.1 hypothetical protein UAY_01816 [Enterococcus moraviensis ATCC BAA-383]EOT73058.1 hypothetical protein I586_00051 [Enterococcus moraviensis ATCC BAA-383]OJG68619.1 hypothetical protein RV09_GL000018 [Enterococcus moraviensis]
MKKIKLRVRYVEDSEKNEWVYLESKEPESSLWSIVVKYPIKKMPDGEEVIGLDLPLRIRDMMETGFYVWSQF